jgi:hypothetical protein
VIHANLVYKHRDDLAVATTWAHGRDSCLARVTLMTFSARGHDVTSRLRAAGFRRTTRVVNCSSIPAPRSWPDGVEDAELLRHFQLAEDHGPFDRIVDEVTSIVGYARKVALCCNGGWHRSVAVALAVRENVARFGRGWYGPLVTIKRM